MNKNKETNNRLIKKNKLKELAGSKNIRISEDAVAEIERIFESKISLLLDLAKENMLINGRRNLKKEDIIEVVERAL